MVAREPKGAYRVRNWPEYNSGLVALGNVAMWIDEGVLTNAAEPGARKRGRPCIYA
ncbi:MAG TPA: IS5/IS1182 family transposase, partial [Paraburkholderia sp.]|nr:IS5/IS1182 family transposase [Paraburkholderia sp.]